MSSTFPWDIEQHRLANGLRVVVSRDPHLPVAAVNVRYGVGSRHDPPGRHGSAHLLEHLMFEGSAQVGPGGHSAMLRAVGGTDINATTTMDRTNYYQTIPPAALDLALWLEADRMAGPALTPDTLATQLAVVARERAQQYEGQPYGQWLEAGLAQVFPESHPYRRPSMGSPTELAGIGTAEVDAFARTHYVPDNAVLTVVGDVRAQTVFDRVEHYFAGIPGAGRKRVPPDPVEEWASRGGSNRRLRDDEAPADRLFVLHRTPPAHTRDHDALDVLAALLGRGRGSVLHRRLMTGEGPAQPEEKTAFAWDLAHGSALFAIGMTVRPGATAEGLAAAVDEVLAEVSRVPVDARRLRRAKAMLTAARLRGLASPGGRADLLGRYASQVGDPESVRDREARHEAVTGADLRRVAARYLGPESRHLLTVGPGR